MPNAYVKWQKAVVNTPLEYSKSLPGSSLANVPPKVRVVKHLPGEHDQSTHGSWAIKPAAPPNYTAVGTLTPLARSRGPIGPMVNHIMDTDGNWYASPEPRPDGYYYHHTELYAMYVLENKKDFKGSTVSRAQEILDEKTEEDTIFEDEIMGEKNFISIATDNWQGLTPYKTFTMKVSGTSPIGVLNKALHLLQRQVRRGNIDPNKYRSFYIARRDFHTIKPGELETIAGFDSKEGIVYKEYKHLPGEHDQSTHTPKKYGAGKDIPLLDDRANIETKLFSLSYIDKDIEYARLLDKDGNALEGDVVGETNRVVLPHTKAQAKKYKDGTAIHNHPTGMGFSVGDYAFAARYNLKQMVVVGKGEDGKKRAFVIRRNGPTWLEWGNNINDVAEVVSDYTMNLKGEFANRVNTEGRFAANLWAWSQIAKIFAKDMGHTYQEFEL